MRVMGDKVEQHLQSCFEFDASIDDAMAEADEVSSMIDMCHKLIALNEELPAAFIAQIEALGGKVCLSH